MNMASISETLKTVLEFIVWYELQAKNQPRGSEKDICYRYPPVNALIRFP